MPSEVPGYSARAVCKIGGTNLAGVTTSWKVDIDATTHRAGMAAITVSGTQEKDKGVNDD